MSSLNHSFSVELAEQYGVECAILISHFQFWIEQNKAMKRNFHDGRTWMYQTQQEIAAIYPYWNRDKVQNLIQKLLDAEVLIKGNYNNTPMDRTCWYAFKNEKMFMIVQNRTMEKEKPHNGKCQTAQAIPYINTVTKQQVVVVVEPPPRSNDVENVHNSGKVVNKDDIYHYSMASKKNWAPIEIEYAWEAFKGAKAVVSDIYAYIDGTIKKKRILEQNRQSKEKYSQKEKSCKTTSNQTQNKQTLKKESKDINLKPMDPDMLAQALAELLGP